MRLSIRGVEFAVPMPTLAQLTLADRAGVIAAVADIGRSHEGFKPFCKGLLDPAAFDALCTAAPACFGTVARAIVARSAGGIAGSTEVLEFSEATVPKALADAYVAQQSASLGTYGADSPLAAIYPIQISPGGQEMLAILRFPNEREVDRFTKDGETFEAAKALVLSCCLHGELARLETVAPYYYKTLAAWLMRKAGSFEAELVGE